MRSSAPAQSSSSSSPTDNEVTSPRARRSQTLSPSVRWMTPSAAASAASRHARHNHALDLFPAEVWQLIFNYAELETLWSMRLVTSWFCQVLRCHIIRRIFQGYSVLCQLYSLTRDRLASTAAHGQLSVDTGSSHHHSHSHSVAANNGDPPPPLGPAQLADIVAEVSLLEPFAVRIIHQMPQLIPAVVNERLLETFQPAPMSPPSLPSITRLSLRDNAHSVDDEEVPPALTLPAAQLPPSVPPGGTVTNTTTTTITSTITLPAPRSPTLPPSKYTHVYEQWAEFDTRLSGIEREQNYQQFLKEVGRRGSAVLSADYARWHRLHQDQTRRVNRILGRVWCVVGMRRYPFTHADNREWKERRRARGVDVGASGESTPISARSHNGRESNRRHSGGSHGKSSSRRANSTSGVVETHGGESSSSRRPSASESGGRRRRSKSWKLHRSDRNSDEQW